MPGRGIRSGKGTAMSRDGTQYEYPDQAGYPDGMGTLHEGTEDDAAGGDRGGARPALRHGGRRRTTTRSV